MITVEDVKQKMQSQTVHTAEVVGTETEKKKKPFYRKKGFWLIVIGGAGLAYYLAKRGKNANSSLEYQ